MYILSFFTLREGEKVEMWERKLLLEFLRDGEEDSWKSKINLDSIENWSK